MPLSESEVLAARALFPFLADGKLYLNHAATSPYSTRVVEALHTYEAERSRGMLETFMHLDMPKIAATRELAALMVNAESPGRIAFTGNTSDALNIVATGLAWRGGDRVLVNTQEFPANIHPWWHLKGLGVEIDLVPCADGRVPAERLLEALTPRTRVLALSAVQFLSGYRADLRTIGTECRRRGVLLVVDGIQAVGSVRVDVQAMKIDALATGCQKWQMSPQGTGYLYLTEDLQSRLHQAYLGWLAVEDPWKFFDFDQPVAPDGRRFEGGTLNIPGIWGMHAALDTLLGYGLDRIEEHILFLTGRLSELLTGLDGLALFSPPGDAERSGIVTVALPPGVDAGKAYGALMRRNLTVSLREGRLRYSPHFYNSAEDMDRAAEETRRALAEARG